MAGQSMVDFGYLQGGNGLDALSATIDDTGNYLAKERERKQKLEEEKRQADMNNAVRERDATTRENAETRRQKREDAQLELGNTERKTKAKERLRADVASGDMASARLHADDYAEINPADNSVKHGLDFEVLPQREVGPPPVKPTGPTRIEEGPRSTPEIEQNAAIARAKTSPDQPEARADEIMNLDAAGQAERERFDQANDPAKVQQNVQAQAAFPGRQAAYNADVKNAKSDQRVRIGGVETSTDELRHSADRQAAADFDKVGEALQKEMSQVLQSGDPRMRADAQRRVEHFQTLRASVEAGTIKPLDAMKRMATMEDLDSKYGAQREHDHTAGEYGLERQRIANQRPQSPGQKATLGLQERKERSSNLRKDVKSELDRYGAKNVQEVASMMPQIQTDLESGNGKLQNEAVIKMMRLAQHDNRFSDADARLAMQSGTDWFGQAQNWFNKGAKGALGPDVVKTALAAARKHNGDYQEQLRGIHKGMESFVEQPDYYDPKEAEQLIRREIPGFGEHLDQRRGSSGSSGGVNPAAVDDIMKEWKARKGR